MKIIRSNELVFVDGTQMKPFVRYVVSDFSAGQLIEMCDEGRWEWSSFNAHERRYNGQDLNGKSVCIYRHNAIGDQLIVSAVPAELKRRYPNAKIHMYCHPQVLPLWEGNPHLGGSAISIPIPFDCVNHANPFSYDYTIFYEGMLENNSEFDQKCCYDDFFGVIGLTDVPDAAKRPCIIPLPRDHVFSNENGFNRLTKTIIYPVAPHNMNRCYPYSHARKLLAYLEAAFSEYTILVVGVSRDPEYLSVAEGCSDKVVNLVNKTTSIRDLIPIIDRASLVITPDTSFLHLAAAFPHVPIISLWGLFHPNDRAKYYKNNFPIFHPEVCKYAPCRDHNFTLPLDKCEKAKGARPRDRIQWCRCLECIEPEEVVSKAKEILG